MSVHYWYALGAILCWASLPAATGSGLSELSTEELMFYSFAAASVFLYGVDVVTKKSFKVLVCNPKVTLFGIWGIFIYHYVYYLALDRIPLAEGAILATTWSLWIVIFSSVLQLKRLAFSILVSALVGFFGAGLVISAGEQLTFQASWIGYGLALLCGVIWSSFSVGLSYLKITEEPMTSFTMVAALLSGLLYLVTFPHAVPSPKAILAAVYLGCVPLGLSFFLWNRAVTGGNLVVIGFLSYLTPPLAVLLVAIIHGQKVPIQVVSGMVIIITASIFGRQCLQRLQKK